MFLARKRAVECSGTDVVLNHRSAERRKEKKRNRKNRIRKEKKKKETDLVSFITAKLSKLKCRPCLLSFERVVPGEVFLKGMNRWPMWNI